MKLLALLLLLLTATIATLLWDTDRGSADADLVIVNRADAFTLDPQRMSYTHDFRLAYALFEPLVRWNNDDFSIEPAASQQWTISDDGTVYEFQINPAARWSNGQPVTAHDFVYSVRRLLLPDTAADYSNLLFVIDGAEAFFHWRLEALQDFAHARQSDDADARVDALVLWEETLQQFDETVGVRALSEHRLQITLARPVPFFLDLLAFAVCCPVYQPAVEGWPEDWSSGRSAPPPFSQRRFASLNAATGRFEQRHGWARPERLIGNGPYVLATWRYKRDLRLQRNEHFHQPHILRNDSILIQTIEDPNTRVMAFTTGGRHWLSAVGTEYDAEMLQQRAAYIERHAAAYESLRGRGISEDEALAQLPQPRDGERRDIHAIPAFASDFYSFNCRQTLANGQTNPFADAAVRRAFVQAVDRQTIVDNVTRLREPVLTSIIPPGSINGYAAVDGLSHDPQQAVAELASAGWSDRDSDGVMEDEQGNPFPTVEILYRTDSERYKWVSLELRSQWQQVLRVPVQLRPVDPKFFKEELKHGNFMIAPGQWYGDYGDPTTFLNIFRTDDGNNDRGYSNPHFDQLLEQAADERNTQQRMKLLQDAERLLFQDQAPMLVLCQLVQVYMYDPAELQGITRHPRLVQYLHELHRPQN